MITDLQMATVKKLRTDTGFGMMDCKKALLEKEWNYEDAKSMLYELREKTRFSLSVLTTFQR